MTWLTTTEAGVLIGRGRDFARARCEDGTFESAYREPGGHWRVLRSDVDAYLARIRAMVRRRKKSVSGE